MNRAAKDEEHAVKELIFDLSSCEVSIRQRAIFSLCRFAVREDVFLAAKERFAFETDPVCRKELEKIMLTHEDMLNPGRIRLVSRPKIEDGERSAPEKESAEKGADSKIREKLEESSEVADETTLNVVNKKTFEDSLKRIIEKLDWAFSNTMTFSRTGLWLLLFVVGVLTVLLTQSIMNRGTNFAATASDENRHGKIFGEIQTESVSSGQTLTGTLKGYEQFAQTWFFLSDDHRLFRLKLDKPPDFYKIEEKLEVYVEDCRKNALGHVVLIARREKAN